MNKDLINSCSGCAHTAEHTLSTQRQRSTKLKISHWFFDQSLTHQAFIFCQKVSWASVLPHNFFTKDSHPFNETFVSGCCNSTFIDVLFTLLLAKNIYFVALDEHFISYCVWYIHSNWLTKNSELYKTTIFFFWTQCRKYIQHHSLTVRATCVCVAINLWLTSPCNLRATCKTVKANVLLNQNAG